MTISVVITTSNGEKYISEQLDSIVSQKRKADEIVIVDDCSTDSTIATVRGFCDSTDTIRLHQNESNQGWRKNFHLAIKKSVGDIIVLCDQDDIWYENKLEIVESVFSSHPEIDLLVSEFDELEHGKLKKKCRSEQLSPIMPNEKLIHTYYPGCTYAFRRTLFNTIEPFWNDELPHDAQLGIAAKIYHSMYVYQWPLIIYRRHQNNATKRTRPSLDKKISYVNAEYAYFVFANKIIESETRPIPNIENTRRIIEEVRSYIDARKELLNNHSFANIMTALGHVKNYYSTKTCLGDIVFALRNNGK